MTTTPSFWGPQTIIAADASAGSSSLAALVEGGFAVVFQRSAGGTKTDVVGRLYTELGALTGGDFLAPTSLSVESISAPEAVQLLNGTLAVPLIYEFGATDHDVRAAILSGPGYTLGSSLQPLDTSSNDDYFLYETVRTADGGIIALWQRDVPGNGNDPVIFRRYDANGFGIGSNVLLGDGPAAESQSNGDIAVLGNGNIVGVWSSFNFTTLTSTLYYRVYDSQGVSLTGNISNFSSGGAFPTVEALQNGNFVIAWQDVSAGVISHQVYNSAGSFVGPRTSTPAGFSILPKLVALADGGYIVGWSDFNGTEGDGSPDGSITLQRYSGTGVPIGIPLIIENPGDQTLEDLAVLTDGRVVVSYINETGDSTNSTNLVYRIIDPREPLIDGTGEADVLVARQQDSQIRALGGADRVWGLGSDDIVFGGAGDDELRGQGGDDHLEGGSGTDTLIGGGGDDHLRGGSGADFLIGDAGTDHLLGGSGNDLLRGGADGDWLFGGSGFDRFDFDATGDSGPAFASQDRIHDFAQGQDVIDLSTIDARTGAPGNQAFAFIGTAAFSAAGQVRYIQQGGTTIVQANTTGPDLPEMIIRLDGLIPLISADFIL